MEHRAILQHLDPAIFEKLLSLMKTKGLNETTGSTSQHINKKRKLENNSCSINVVQQKVHFALVKNKVKIGRSHEICDIALTHQNIFGKGSKKILSRLHCCIHYEKKEGKDFWMIIDEKSRNGTFVNGKKLEAEVETELNHNDLIQLGPSFKECEAKLTFQFVSEEDEPNLELTKVESIEKSQKQEEQMIKFKTILSDLINQLKSIEEIHAGDRELVQRTSQMLLKKLHGVSCKDLLQHSSSVKQLTTELTCSICCELFLYAQTLSCGHSFCKTCIDQWLKSSLSCPLCREVVQSVPHPSLALDKSVQILINSLSSIVPKSNPGTNTSEEETCSPFETYLQRKKDYIDGEEQARIHMARLVDYLDQAKNLGFVLVKVAKPWSDREQLRFLQGIRVYYGLSRVTYCESVSLTDEFIDSASNGELLVVCENLRILPVAGRFVVDKEEEANYASWVNEDPGNVRTRLKLFIRYT